MAAGGSAARDGGFFRTDAGIAFANSRFIALSVTGTSGSFVPLSTIREISGRDGSVTLDGWAVDLARPETRELPWQATQLACSPNVCALAGRADGGEQLVVVHPASGFATPNAPITLPSQPRTLVRLRILPTAVAPLALLTNENAESRLWRFGVSTNLLALSTGTVSTPVVGDDFLPLTSSTAVVGRCADLCIWGTLSEAFMGVVPRLAIANVPSIEGPFVAASLRGLSSFADAPLRVGWDGASILGVAGQTSTGQLLVEQRGVNGVLNNSYVSSSPLRLISAHSDTAGIYYLAQAEGPNAFDGIAIPNVSNDSNVVIIKLSNNPNSIAVVTYDLPLAQAPVELVTLSSGFGARLYVAVNQGTEAHLWSVPQF